MELQTLINKLTTDIEEKNHLLVRAEAEHRDTSKMQMELDAALEYYSTIFNVIPMLM